MSRLLRHTAVLAVASGALDSSSHPAAPTPVSARRLTLRSDVERADEIRSVVRPLVPDTATEETDEVEILSAPHAAPTEQETVVVGERVEAESAVDSSTNRSEAPPVSAEPVVTGTVVEGQSQRRMSLLEREREEQDLRRRFRELEGEHTLEGENKLNKIDKTSDNHRDGEAATHDAGAARVTTGSQRVVGGEHETHTEDEGDDFIESEVYFADEEEKPEAHAAQTDFAMNNSDEDPELLAAIAMSLASGAAIEGGASGAEVVVGEVVSGEKSSVQQGIAVAAPEMEPTAVAVPVGNTAAEGVAVGAAGSVPSSNAEKSCEETPRGEKEQPIDLDADEQKLEQVEEEDGKEPSEEAKKDGMEGTWWRDLEDLKTDQSMQHRPVRPDGNCMYHAVYQQLPERHKESFTEAAHGRELRLLVASYVEQLFADGKLSNEISRADAADAAQRAQQGIDEEQGFGEAGLELSPENALSRDCWGGSEAAQALACVLGVRIDVFQDATGRGGGLVYKERYDGRGLEDAGDEILILLHTGGHWDWLMRNEDSRREGVGAKYEGFVLTNSDDSAEMRKAKLDHLLKADKAYTQKQVENALDQSRGDVQRAEAWLHKNHGAGHRADGEFLAGAGGGAFEGMDASMREAQRLMMEEYANGGGAGMQQNEVAMMMDPHEAEMQRLVMERYQNGGGEFGGDFGGDFGDMGGDFNVGGYGRSRTRRLAPRSLRGNTAYGRQGGLGYDFPDAVQTNGGVGGEYERMMMAQYGHALVAPTLPTLPSLPSMSAIGRAARDTASNFMAGRRRQTRGVKCGCYSCQRNGGGEARRMQVIGGTQNVDYFVCSLCDGNFCTADAMHECRSQQRAAGGFF